MAAKPAHFPTAQQETVLEESFDPNTADPAPVRGDGSPPYDIFQPFHSAGQLGVETEHHHQPPPLFKFNHPSSTQKHPGSDLHKRIPTSQPGLQETTSHPEHYHQLDKPTILA
ncbi:hypothetical protein PGTUg99_030594 [Puccinia graminis f. sp. tritici]|uniref:Uncharacterized protein n=1 Tax=Puccinia graminis f. sp. tritici TaxID=56615 RepID=A0A5B0REJ7_PUCGR|nr:hypothetical protein PGTUg99_030594 [Puccinia graminis f. sp. tritici]